MTERKKRKTKQKHKGVDFQQSTILFLILGLIFILGLIYIKIY